MKRSTDRFLTTHTGSLPRPDDLVRAMFAREEGVPVDGAALAARIRSGVADVVRKQAEAGLDVIDDGELSKPSYATYVKDRLAGFGGTSQPLQYQDLVDFPDLAKRVFGDPGRSRRRTPACNGPIGVRDARAAEADAANLKAALASVRRRGGLPDRRVAGRDLPLLPQRPLPEPRGLPRRHRGRDAGRVRGRGRGRAPPPGGLSGPGDGAAHPVSPGSASRSSAGWRGSTSRRSTTRSRNIPPDRVRMHVCWGNYEGPHHHDVPLADIIDIVFLARPAGVSFEAANPRHAHEWRLFERVRVPEGKVLIPGVLESKTNYIEHPELVAQRIGRYAKLVGRENVIAGTDCGYGTWVGQAAVDPGRRVGQAPEPRRGRAPRVARVLAVASQTKPPTPVSPAPPLAMALHGRRRDSRRTKWRRRRHRETGRARRVAHLDASSGPEDPVSAHGSRRGSARACRRRRCAAWPGHRRCR